MAYDHSQTDEPPVTDWLHDWDWLDPAWGVDAISIWNSIREQCPVASTERYGRAFLPVTMEAVQAIAQDTEHFSSWRVSVARPDAPPRAAPPITSDQFGSVVTHRPSRGRVARSVDTHDRAGEHCLSTPRLAHDAECHSLMDDERDTVNCFDCMSTDIKMGS
jgi:hypothetical protein